MAERIRIYNDPRVKDPGVSDTVSRLLDALGEIFPGKGIIIQFHGVNQFYVEAVEIDQTPISEQECAELLRRHINEILGDGDHIEMGMDQYQAFRNFFTDMYNRLNYDPNIDPVEDQLAVLRPQWVDDSQINRMMKRLDLPYEFSDTCDDDSRINGCEIIRKCVCEKQYSIPPGLAKLRRQILGH